MVTDTAVSIPVRGGKPPTVTAKWPVTTPQNRGGKVVANDARPERTVVATGYPFSVVANDDDDDTDDEQITYNRPSSRARIEVRSRKRKSGRVYILGWRWQLKENGRPLRTASGGYKRGYRYVKTVGSKREADRLKKALTG